MQAHIQSKVGQPGPDSGPTTPGSASKPGDDVIDAEYEVKK